MPIPVFAEGLSHIRLVARHTQPQYGQIRFEPHLPVSALVLCLLERVAVCPPEGGLLFCLYLSADIKPKAEGYGRLGDKNLRYKGRRTIAMTDWVLG